MIMDIGIITHYDVHNHGALLQLNALVKTLQREGYKAVALQFEKNYDFLGIEQKEKYNISFRSVPYYLKYLVQKGVRKTLFNIAKKCILDRFKCCEELVGDYYTTYRGLKNIIVGSDEVFALHTGPTPVFWGHALPSDNVFTYAGCFGPTTMDDIREKHCVGFAQSGLMGMSHLSARDKNSCEIMENLTERNVQCVCDPVLLYGYQKELHNLPKVELPPYLLVYAYDNNMNEPQEVAIIKKYAKAHGLQVISPGFYHDWCDKSINVDPVTLLAYFRDATCVVTDTFHGSVMSILTNAPLAVKMRGNGNKLGNLLEEYGLTNRILSEDKTLSTLFETSIDWKKVNEEIYKRRSVSMAYLFNSLKG